MVKDAQNRSFASWVVSSERGRFIIYTGAVKGLAMEEIFQFADDPETLIQVLRQTGKRFKGAELDFNLLVTRELHKRIVDEFKGAGQE